jgi:beta-galactosidase
VTFVFLAFKKRIKMNIIFENHPCNRSTVASGIFLFLLVTALSAFAQTFPRKDLRFTDNWKFYLGEAAGAQATGYSDASWTAVCLPHTARVESAITHGSWDYYQGYYWYRKSFTPDTSWRGKKVFLEVEAGMQTTQVWVNGVSKLTYQGGYNPFTIDITGDLVFNQTNVIAMRLNNAAIPDFSPGAEHRDFYYYGGLYRYVNLHVTDSLHITDAVYANTPAGGGVFVTYPAATASSATVQVKTHVINESGAARTCVLTTAVLDANGSIAQTASVTQSIAAGASYAFMQSLIVANPRLWSPSAPNLYTVRSQVFDNTRAADQVMTPIGIRRIAFSRTSGLQINGLKLIAKGVNRHQDYGAIGCAVPVSGQYRDALRLKEAGINFVRLSHYLQHPAFLDACDKLGITVEASLVGWQFNGFANTNFVNNSVRDLRTMIRYYRNHPCVVMWESVHNESAPPASFANLTQAAAHEEFPGDQMFTCGQETGNIMDIYQAAVQQGGRTYASAKPQAISEYGHWEYGGFTYGGASSNQPRAIGEAGMLQLAGNQAEAMNQDHALSWLSVDALWVYNETFGFDSYRNSLCGGGIVDVFRIPKFGYYFYQSQRDPSIVVPGVGSGPMVYIANFLTPSSPLTVRVFSNCAQVRLTRNSTVIATKSPDALANVEHPPFTFTLPSFASGTLLAEGLIGGAVKATHQVKTPGTAACVALKLDTAAMPLAADGADLAIAYASIVDANGTVVPAAANPVTFTVNGPGRIISGDGNPTAAVAGIAAVYVQTQYNTPGTIVVTASAAGLCSGSDTVKSVAASNDISTALHRPVAIIASGPGSATIVQHGALISIIVPADRADAGLKPKFRLYNMQGRLVRSLTIEPGPETLLPVNDCARGMYLGRLTTGSKEYCLRLLSIRP